MIKRIDDYVEAEYKQGEYIRSTIKYEYQYTIPRTTYPVTNSTTTENDFDTMVLNMEVDMYVKRKYILEENIYK